MRFPTCIFEAEGRGIPACLNRNAKREIVVLLVLLGLDVFIEHLDMALATATAARSFYADVIIQSHTRTKIRLVFFTLWSLHLWLCPSVLLIQYHYPCRSRHRIFTFWVLWASDTILLHTHVKKIWSSILIEL